MSSHVHDYSTTNGQHIVPGQERPNNDAHHVGTLQARCHPNQDQPRSHDLTNDCGPLTELASTYIKDFTSTQPLTSLSDPSIPGALCNNFQEPETLKENLPHTCHPRVLPLTNSLRSLRVHSPETSVNAIPHRPIKRDIKDERHRRDSYVSIAPRDAKRKSQIIDDGPQPNEWAPFSDAMDLSGYLEPSSRGPKHAKKPRTNKMNILRFGCPFAKHDRERYSEVYNSCTCPPGLEPARVVEHVARVHSSRYSCIYCGLKWDSGDDWEQSLRAHIESGSCITVDERLRKPECMTEAQESTYRQENHDKLSAGEKWAALYMRLFPGQWPIPTAGYDYYVARHRVQPPVERAMTLPIAFQGPPTGDVTTVGDPGHQFPDLQFCDIPGTANLGDWTEVRYA